MKNKALVKVLAVCFLAVAMTGCQAIQGIINGVSPKSVNTASVSCNGAICEVTDSETRSSLATLIATGRIVSIDMLDVPESLAEVTLGEVSGESHTYNVYEFARYSGYLYLMAQNGRFIEIPADEFWSILSRDDMLPLYGGSNFPEITISADDRTGDLPIADYEWQYKRLDGNFYTLEREVDETGYKYEFSSPAAPILEFSHQPSSVIVKVEKDGKQVYVGSLNNLKDFKMSEIGRYSYEINAVWSEQADCDFKGRICSKFTVEYEPKAGFQISAVASDPGETLVIYARGLAEDEEITVKSPFKYVPQFLPYGGNRVAFFPVSYNNKIGSYILELSSKSAYAKYEITIKDKEFDVQDLTVDKETEKETIANNKAAAEFNKVFYENKEIRDPEKYFEGTFVKPVNSKKITTTFGAMRSINGGAASGHHDGIDYAAKTGVRVNAANNGRVIFAGKLQMTGNTVIIEHGYGLKTWYYHMNSLDVEKDDMVKKGDKIGTVGSTGFSTGPHLHFAMSVNGVYINPETAMENILLD